MFRACLSATTIESGGGDAVISEAREAGKPEA